MKRSSFNPVSLQLCKPDTVKSSHLSYKIHAFASANQIYLLTVPWRQQMSYSRMASTCLSPNGYRGLQYSLQYPRTLCPADAAAVIRMERMHVTSTNAGRMSPGPSGLSVAQLSGWSLVTVQTQGRLSVP